MASYKKTLSFTIPAGSTYQPTIPSGKVYIVEKVACSHYHTFSIGAKPRYLLAINVAGNVIDIFDFRFHILSLLNPKLLLWDGVQVMFYNNHFEDVGLFLVCNVIEESNFISFEDGILEISPNSSVQKSFTGYSGVKIPFWGFSCFNSSYGDYTFNCDVSLVYSGNVRYVHRRSSVPISVYERGFFVDNGYILQVYNPDSETRYFYYQAVKFKHI